MEEQYSAHEFIDLDTGEIILIPMTDAAFFAYLHETFGDFRMDDEEEEEG